MTEGYDSAYRKVETTGTSCNKIETTIILPNLADLNVGNGGVLYNYLGCSRAGVFDFEFGFGYKPSETGSNEKYGIYRSGTGMVWSWLKQGSSFYLFDPGTYRILLTIPQNNTIRIQVYYGATGSSLAYSNDFPISGARADGAGQKVRRNTSLMVLSGHSGSALNSRWTTTTIRQGGIDYNATPSNCTAGRYSEPSGNLNWVTLNSHNQFYNETISLQIR